MNQTENQGVESQSELTAQGQSTPPRKTSGLLWKAVVVLIVLAALVITIVLKSSTDRQAGRSATRKERMRFAETEVLATVNGEKITVADLQSELEGMDEEFRSIYEEAKDELLEDMIARKVLLQEAKRLHVAETAVYKKALSEQAGGAEREDDALLSVLLKTQVLDQIQITEEELRSVYEQRGTGTAPEQDFDVIKESLRTYLLQQKQDEAVREYVSKLRDDAEISRNEAWIEVQRAPAADNPLDRALSTGRPVVADFGRGECIPCKMMKPILERLAEEFTGEAEILIIDIDEYPKLKRRCGVRFIPAQIFYDASGSEVYRHEGFMPEEDIREQLAKLGVG